MAMLLSLTLSWAPPKQSVPARQLRDTEAEDRHLQRRLVYYVRANYCHQAFGAAAGSSDELDAELASDAASPGGGA